MTKPMTDERVNEILGTLHPDDATELENEIRRLREELNETTEALAKASKSLVALGDENKRLSKVFEEGDIGPMMDENKALREENEWQARVIQRFKDGEMKMASSWEVRAEELEDECVKLRKVAEAAQNLSSYRWGLLSQAVYAMDTQAKEWDTLDDALRALRDLEKSDE